MITFSYLIFVPTFLQISHQKKTRQTCQMTICSYVASWNLVVISKIITNVIKNFFIHLMQVVESMKRIIFFGIQLPINCLYTCMVLPFDHPFYRQQGWRNFTEICIVSVHSKTSNIKVMVLSNNILTIESQ